MVAYLVLNVCSGRDGSAVKADTTYAKQELTFHRQPLDLFL